MGGGGGVTTSGGGRQLVETGLGRWAQYLGAAEPSPEARRHHRLSSMFFARASCHHVFASRTRSMLGGCDSRGR